MGRPEIQLQLRRDVAADWTSVNPILAEGEMGVEVDTLKIKVGDGIQVWVDLPYISGDTATTSDTTNALNTTTNPVNVSLALAPTVGMVLMATDATHATWQTLGDANHFHSRLDSPDGTSYAPALSVDNNGQIFSGTTTPDASIHHARPNNVSTIFQNLATGGAQNDSYVEITEYIGYASDDTSEIVFASVAANMLSVDVVGSNYGELLFSVSMGDGNYKALSINSKKVYSERDTTVQIFNKNGELFAEFLAETKSLRIGPETSNSTGILQLETDPSISGNEYVKMNVGESIASAGVFTRNFAAGFLKQDVGTLTDDGVLKISSDGFVGSGYIWASTSAGYDDHVHCAHFSFDYTGVNLFNAVKSVKNTDTDGNLCLYVSGGELFLKNRLGYTANVGYTANYYDNNQLTVPVTELTWTATSEAGDWRDVTMSHDGAKIFASPFFGDSRESTNSGVVWSDVPDFVSTKYASTNAMSSDGVYRLAGGAAPNDPKPLYLSTNSGANFTSLTVTSGTLTNVTFNATTRKIIRASGSWITNGFTAGMQIYITGSSKPGNNEPFKILSVTATEITLIVGSVLTSDSTAGESIVVKAMEERWKGSAICDNGTKMIAVAQGQIRGVIAISANSGVTWTTKAYGDWRDCCISADGTKMYACSYTGYVTKSTDSGSSFSSITITKHPYVSISCSDDGTIILLGTQGGYLYYSTDSGASWDEVASMGTGQWGGNAISANGAVMIACSHSGAVVMSYDTGANWVRQSIPAHAWMAVTLNGAGTASALVSEDPTQSIYLGA